MQEVPVVEVLCLNHFVWYILPYLNAHPVLLRYPAEVRSTAGWALGLYVLAIQAGGSMLRLRRRSGQRNSTGFLDRHLNLDGRAYLLPTFYGAWVFFDLLLATGSLPYFSAFLALARSLVSSVGLIALFFLSYRTGQELRLHKPGHAWLLMAAISFHMLVVAASGSLSNTSLVLFGALAPYSLGRKQPPILALIVAVACLGFLHLGKAEMRQHFWGEDGADRGPVNPIEVYEFWIPASWEAMVDAKTQPDDEDKTDIWKRASLMHMLAMVVSETPDVRDYLGGETYAMIPMLMVPRFMWPDKPRASLPMERLGIYYEIMTEETNDVTSVTFGQATEAWANFGWFGMAGVGFCFGLVAGIGNRISFMRPLDSIGFLLAGILLSRVWDVGNSAGTIILGALQGLSFALVFLYLLTRRSKNSATENAAFSPRQVKS
ncbi:MAG: hypothetical protein WCO94_00530 [Verrucomicrobiota bacterium]